jgi:tripartite-type tricarboxylate transporter receptor subunit TctC
VSFPDRPISFVMPFGPEGSTDTVAFIMREALSAELGQEVQIDRIDGGIGGSNGPRAVAASAADGYTMIMGTVGNMCLLTSLYPDYGVTPLRDFTPVSMIAYMPDILVAHTSLGVSTVDELAALAKSRPGETTYNGINPGSIHRVEAHWLMQAYGIDLRHVAYENAQAGIDGIVAGEIDVLFTTSPRLLPHIKAGKLVPLGAAAPDRARAIPEIPTFLDLGVPSLRMGSWMGIFVPAGTPHEVVDALHAAATKTVKLPEIESQIVDAGMELSLSASPAEFRAFVETETARMAEVVQAFDLTL